MNPKLFMGARVTRVDDDTLEQAWRHVRAVVESHDLALGVRLAVPQLAISPYPPLNLDR